MAKVDWDQSQDEASKGFELLPKGRYPSRVTSSDRKETTNKDGYYFEFEFEVVKGDFSKRKLWARLNVSNPSETAQRIGREQFKALCVACGKPDGVKKTEELHGKYVVCIVDIERGTGGYADKNRVNGFMSPESFKGSGEETEVPAPAPKGKGAKETPKKGAADDDDDIPF